MDSSAKDTNYATTFLSKSTIATASRVVSDIISVIPQSLNYISVSFDFLSIKFLSCFFEFHSNLTLFSVCAFLFTFLGLIFYERNTDQRYCSILHSILHFTCCSFAAFAFFQGAKVSEVKVWQTFVHFLVLMSSCNGWLLVRNAPQVQKVLNDLCNKMCSSLGEPANFSRLANSLFIASNEHKPVLCAQALNALFSTLMKYVKNDDSLLPLFVSQVLTCPAIISHLSQANLDAFLASGLFDRCLTLLRASSDVVDNIEPQRTINLLGNVIHLGYLDEETVKGRIVDWTWVIGLAMAQCTEFAVRPGEQSSHNHWHPIFGNYKLPIDPKTERSLRNVLRQLQMLWSYRIVCRLFDKALEGVDQSRPNGHVPVKELGATFNSLF
ncbi:unnamed protein product [Nippostrongylus brasiliensis]|uniref:HECT-type E3 ubiquitin transferase n=1 Tax=Nippostrongylus brasiliensis TaxID=27835 RepID=A0A0N4XIT3_NIPBR|nr:unnamed protein product [Nippostrongylus brasiliensis]